MRKIEIKHHLTGEVLFEYEKENNTIKDTLMEAIKKGADLSGGQALRLFGFLVSFSGWLALCLLVIPIIFVAPYIFASFAVYGREEYRAKKEI